MVFKRGRTLALVTVIACGSCAPGPSESPAIPERSSGQVATSRTPAVLASLEPARSPSAGPSRAEAAVEVKTVRSDRALEVRITGLDPFATADIVVESRTDSMHALTQADAAGTAAVRFDLAPTFTGRISVFRGEAAARALLSRLDLPPFAAAPSTTRAPAATAAVLTPRPAGSPPPSVTFSFGPGVNADDQAVYRDGIARASRYQEALFGRGVGAPTAVVIISSASGDKPPAWWFNYSKDRYASSVDQALAGRNEVFLDQDGFELAFAATSRTLGLTRTAVQEQNVAHEYTHVWQYTVGCDGLWPRRIPRWWSEGMAQYLADETVIGDGLASREAIDTFNLRVMKAAPVKLTLQTLEASWPSVSESGPISTPYQVATFAVQLLAATAGTSSFTTFCQRVAAGSSWQAAFAPSFGLTLAEFYARWEKYRDGL